MLTVPLDIEVDPDDSRLALPFLHLDVNGQAVRALLDTGAARTAITAPPGTVTRPAETIGHSAFGTPYEDRLWQAAITLDHTPIGSVEIADQPEGDRCNVGQDLLSRFCCHYRLANRQLILDGPTPSQVQPVYLDPGKHVYFTAHWPTGDSADCVFDTGASITVVDTGFAEQHPGLIIDRGASTGTDASGDDRTTPLVDLEGPTVLGHDFASSAAAIVDLSAANATIPRPMDLILGWPLISQVDWFIDNPNATAALATR